MKMVFNSRFEDNMTYGKIYDCKHYSFDEYSLINDKGDIYSYPVYFFISIKEHREELIDNLLEYDKILYWKKWRNTF